MLVGKTRNDVDRLWDAFHSGGITNPVSVIEQINYLLFIRRLDDIESRAERLATRTGEATRRIFDKNQQELRWSSFKQLKPEMMLTLVQEKVFPFIKSLGASNGEGQSNLTTFSKTLSDAVFLIPKASLLSSAVELISGLDLDNADTAGDLYEYLLSKLATSGINGQFRTPRHIIRMMVELMDPDIVERICDPACGTAGFLFTALQYILEKYTSPKMVQVEEDGTRHGFIGDLMSPEQRKKFERDTFFGFDFDATMLRVASMNMWLHGIEAPSISYADTLSKSFEQESCYDLILANPPFKGKLDYGDCSPSLLSEVKTKNTELLFLILALRLLDIGGRAAIIVPDGVLFNSSNAHLTVRKQLVEDHQLEGVISMPSGIFKPYAGVSTAVLIFSKGGQTDKVWFYDMEHDGYSLDDKRQKLDQNDIPDIIACWKHRHDQAFDRDRQSRMTALTEEMAPLKRERLEHQQGIDQLVFDSVIAAGDALKNTELGKQKSELEKLDERIHLLQREFNQLSRQFWVTKTRIVDNDFDLRASQYRRIERDEIYFPEASTIFDRLQRLQTATDAQLKKVEALI